jgi:hypothetical protein
VPASMNPNVPLSFVQSVGTATQAASASTLAVTVPAGGCAVGHLVVVHFAGFNYTSGSVTIADTRSNTWAHPFTKTNSTFGINEVWYSVLATALQAGDTITVTMPTGDQCYAMTADEFAGVSPAAGQPWANDATGATGTSTAPSDNLNPGATAPAVLWYAGMSVDSLSGETFTEDSTNTTGGNWVSLTPALAASATNPQSIHNAYKIPNTALSSTQTWTPTLGTSRDWIVNLVVFSGNSTGEIVGRATMAVLRAATR